MIQFQDRRGAAWCFVTETNQIKSPCVNKSLWLVISHPVREYKYSLGFWISLRGFRIPCTRFQSLSVEPGFQPLMGFRTLWVVFLILKPRFPVSIRKTFPNSSSKKFPGIRNPLHEMSYPILILRLRKGYLSDLNFSYILNNTSWFQLATPYYNERWCFCLKWLAEVKRSYLT